MLVPTSFQTLDELPGRLRDQVVIKHQPRPVLALHPANVVAAVGRRPLCVTMAKSSCGLCINQPTSPGIQKSFLGDDAAVLAPSSGEELAKRHAIEALRRWRGGRRDDSARAVSTILRSATKVLVQPALETLPMLRHYHLPWTAPGRG